MANKKFFVPGVVLAGTMLVASCASPLTTPGTGVTLKTEAAQPAAVQMPGQVTVPLTLPGLDERSLQYAYDKALISTVIVTLIDAHGTYQQRYVTRNFGASGKSGGQANLTFENVAPGEFVVTVRTSDHRLFGTLSESNVISHDAEKGVYYFHDSANDPFAGYNQAILLSGSPTSPVLVFDPGEINQNYLQDCLIPDYESQDGSSTKRGYGTGAAWGVLEPGKTKPVSIQVGQLPQFAARVMGQNHEGIAGEAITMEVADAANVQEGDRILISNGQLWGQTVHPWGSNYDVVPLTKDGNRVRFTPTKAVNNGYVYLLRGNIISRIGFNSAQSPRLTVSAGLLDPLKSFFRYNSNIISTASQFIFSSHDLRDAYGNVVNGTELPNKPMTYSYLVTAATLTAPELNQAFLVPGATQVYHDGGNLRSGSVSPSPLGVRPTFGTFTGTDATKLAWTAFTQPSEHYAANGRLNTGTFTLTTGAITGTNVEVEFKAPRFVGGMSTIATASVPVTLATGATLAIGGATFQNTAATDFTFAALQTYGFPVNSFGARKTGDTDTLQIKAIRHQGVQGAETLLKQEDLVFTYRN
ncbi:hypothetical protein D3C86_352520 [compost metagenome]